jgi:hypothetical protein
MEAALSPPFNLLYINGMARRPVGTPEQF